MDVVAVDDETWEEMSSSSSSSSSEDEEDIRLFEEEFEKHGEYDFDASKVGSLVVYYPVVFENTRFATEPETDGDLVQKLSEIALKKYNADMETNFELVRAVKANWNLGAGYIFSITLEAKDASPNSEPIPFHAKVAYLYLPGGTTVFDIKPRP